MRKPKLPKRETEICERLRYAREEVLEMTQDGCAKQIGLDRSTLANYETSRTPLRYDIALRFCRQFIICEEWLATGQFDACHRAAEAHGITGKAGWDFFDKQIFIRQCMDLWSDSATLHLKPGTLFSEAFSTALAPRFDHLVNHYFYGQPIVLSAADDPEIAENLLKAIHERHILLLCKEASPRLQAKESDMWRLYTRYLFECSGLIFKKLMGMHLPDEYLSELQWLRNMLTDPDAAIGPPNVVVVERPRGVDPRDAQVKAESSKPLMVQGVSERDCVDELLEALAKDASAGLTFDDLNAAVATIGLNRNLSPAAREFLTGALGRLQAKLRDAPPRGSQESLDIIALANDNTDMQIVKSLPELRNKLKQLTSKRGAKAALARKLKVSRQAVDQWLNGSTTPSADILIKVMNME